MNRTTYVIIIIIFFLSGTSCTEEKETAVTISPKMAHLPINIDQLEAIDLRPILEMVGDAKIIGLSEANHYMKEPLDFRNELIKFLIKEKRIDVVVLESGIIESKYLFDYVNGEEGNIDSVLFNGVSWTFDQLPQNKTLIKWLRKYNQDSLNVHKVKLYGFDIPGSPLNPYANRKMNTAILAALAYLEVVDHANGVKLRKRLKPLMAYIHTNISDTSVKQYFHLEATRRRELTTIVDDLLRLYEINKWRYIKQTSEENYDWSYLAAKSSKNVDNWLQTIPLDFKLSAEISETVFSDFFWNLHGERDVTMANNMTWIMAREKNANLLIFGHMNHISKSTQTLVLEDSTRIIKKKQLGQYLDSKYQEDYQVIGNFQFKIKRPNHTTQADDDAFEKILSQKYSSNYYYVIAEKDKEWMNKEWKIGVPFLNAKTYMNPYQGMDIIFFNPLQTEIIVNG